MVVSALSNCLPKESEDEVLDDIFGETYINLIEACQQGRITDDNKVVSGLLKLIEQILPKMMDAYKSDPEEYESRTLAIATSLRVTIDSFIPIETFMEIMNRPQMKQIDAIVHAMVEGKLEEPESDNLIDVFKSMKPVKEIEPDIYG